MKRDKYDSVLSDLVRERANWTCEKCKKISTQGQGTGQDRDIQCSHFNGRGNGNVSRYDSDLLFCLCASCHTFVETRPKEHTKFVESIVGEAFLDIKSEQHHKPYKMYKNEKEEMHQHYKSELKRVKELRSNGEMDYIETTSWF